jgi:hypothetical protein
VAVVEDSAVVLAGGLSCVQHLLVLSYPTFDYTGCHLNCKDQHQDLLAWCRRVWLPPCRSGWLPGGVWPVRRWGRNTDTVLHLSILVIRAGKINADAVRSSC